MKSGVYRPLKVPLNIHHLLLACLRIYLGTYLLKVLPVLTYMTSQCVITLALGTAFHRVTQNKMMITHDNT